MFKPMMDVAATATNIAISAGGTRIFSPAGFVASPARVFPVNSPMEEVHRKCSPHSVVAKEKPYPASPMSCLFTITIATDVKMLSDHANASIARFDAALSPASDSEPTFMAPSRSRHPTRA